MAEPRWSVGLAFVDRAVDGIHPESIRVVYTAMSALIHHPEVAEVIVVDNDPLPNNTLPALLAKTRKARYVPMPEPKGTSPPRNRVFEEASQEYVACVDAHVLLHPGFFAELNKFYALRGGRCKDLLHGTMVNEDGTPHAHHMNAAWRDFMWGVWGLAWKSPAGGLFSCSTADDRNLFYWHVGGDDHRPMTMGEIEDNGLPWPLPWPGHEERLRAIGCTHPAKPYRIPGHGMGFFACRKDAWIPFHSRCRGFGGEEMTTHMRFRQAGRSAWCVPGAKWWHHYERPFTGQRGGAGVPYRLVLWDRIRNYVLEFQRMGLPLDTIRAHFHEGVMPQREWDQVVAGREWPQ